MKLTEAQKRTLAAINSTGFVEARAGFGTSQSNRPAWKLVELGLADFDWGPSGSFLKTQGFVPTPAGRTALKETGE